MAFRIQLNDHSEAVLAQMDANVERALTAMGIKAVGLIVRQMESGYTTPHKNRTHGTTSDGGTHTAIRETGDLMRDVSYEVGNSGAGTVDVGNSLISTHAPREGCDGSRELRISKRANFNPRTPRGVRHSVNRHVACSARISIHAPREGCDWPLRGLYRGRRDFNPRTPRGVRQHPRRVRIPRRGISIHEPREGCDRRKRYEILV